MLLALTEVDGYKTIDYRRTGRLLELEDLNGDGMFTNADMQSRLIQIARVDTRLHNRRTSHTK